MTTRRHGLPDIFRSSLPPLLPYQGPIPPVWTARGRWTQGPLHYFCDDYRQEACWRHPHDASLRAHAALFTTAPDFSIFDDDPHEWAAYQTFRAFSCARLWQSAGAIVLPIVPCHRYTATRCPAPEHTTWALRLPPPRLQPAHLAHTLAAWAEKYQPHAVVLFGLWHEAGHLLPTCDVLRRRLHPKEH